mgnify:CR=1 FL=1
MLIVSGESLQSTALPMRESHRATGCRRNYPCCRGTRATDQRQPCDATAVLSMTLCDALLPPATAGAAACEPGKSGVARRRQRSDPHIFRRPAFAG